MRELLDILAAIRTWPGPPRELVLATVTRVEGSAYRHPGARLLLGPGGPLCGSVSGGCLEGDLQARAAELAAPGDRRLLRYDLRGDLDLIWGTGSGCEGVAEILLERLGDRAGEAWLAAVEEALAGRRTLRLATGLDPDPDSPWSLGTRRVLEASVPEPDAALVERLEPPVALWCFGAGDDAKPLVQFATVLGWTVGLADHRPAYLSPARFPGVATLLSGRPGATVPRMRLDARSACVLLSHHWERDQEALRLLLPSPAGYLGLLGHRKRGSALLAALAADGFAPTPEQLARLHTPVGLDLGGSGPEAIALAVVAEILASFSGREGRPLRLRAGPVHG